VEEGFGVIRSTWTDINRVDDCEDGARDSEWIHLVSVILRNRYQVESLIVRARNSLEIAHLDSH